VSALIAATGIARRQMMARLVPLVYAASLAVVVARRVASLVRSHS
jgi:hypothetical protein